MVEDHLGQADSPRVIEHMFFPEVYSSSHQPLPRGLKFGEDVNLVLRGCKFGFKSSTKRT